MAKVNTMAAVSSTGNPRVALEVTAWTLTMSPTSDSRLFTSWVRLSRDGTAARFAPPPAADVVVVVGLVEHCGAHHRDDWPEDAAVHNLLALAMIEL